MCVYIFNKRIRALSGIPSVPWMTTAAFKAARGARGMKAKAETEFIQFTWDSSVRGTKERERRSEKGGSSWNGLRQLPESCARSIAAPCPPRCLILDRETRAKINASADTRTNVYPIRHITHIRMRYNATQMRGVAHQWIARSVHFAWQNRSKDRYANNAWTRPATARMWTKETERERERWWIRGRGIKGMN